MNMRMLKNAVAGIQEDLEKAIKTARFSGNDYENGQKAKEALIRSQRLIQQIHEVTKVSLASALDREGLDYEVHPPRDQTSPELSITGFIKAKQQDIVFLMGDGKGHPERIEEGPLAGEMDRVGRKASESSIVVGVRSQLSSVAKNFDTLMERAFAETLNLRLRLRKLVMAEVYMLPVVEYDDVAMVRNRVAFKEEGHVPLEKFIRTFLAISGRDDKDLDGSLYKYDRSCLVLVDFRDHPPRVFTTFEELQKKGLLSKSFQANYARLSPVGFSKDVVHAYRERHGL